MAKNDFYKNEITIRSSSDKIRDFFIFVVPTVPIVKDQSRVAGSANLTSGNTAVSTASMITGENTRTCHEVIILPRNLDKKHL